MEKLREDLRSLVKSLKALTRQTENIQKRLEKLQKAQVAKKLRSKAPAKGVRRRVAKEVKRTTASDMVLKMIERRKRGMTTAEIKAKTGFKKKKIWDIVYRVKRQGRIKSPRKGVYIRA